MSLISPEQFAQIGAAIKQVTETFFKIDVTIVRRTRKLSAYNQSRKDTHSEATYQVLALSVYDKEGEDAQSKRTDSGSFDLSDGYLLIHNDVLKAAGLMDADGNPTITAHQDTVKFAGDEWEIDGVNLVGPLDTGFALTKIHFSAVKHE